MRHLSKVDEFKAEASNAIFTKQQATAVILQLLTAEAQSSENSPADQEILAKAIKQADFRYIDAKATDTDRLLDSCGVARITTPELVSAIEAMLFDAK